MTTFGNLPIYTDKDVPAGTIDLCIEPTDEKPTGLYVNSVDVPRLRALLAKTEREQGQP